MADTIEEQLIKHLTDAHSIEEQALAQMRVAPRIAGDADLAQAFREHIAETFHRAMQGSTFSIVRDPDWRPSLGPNSNTFRMSDLLMVGYRGQKNQLAPLGDTL